MSPKDEDRLAALERVVALGKEQRNARELLKHLEEQHARRCGVLSRDILKRQEAIAQLCESLGVQLS